VAERSHLSIGEVLSLLREEFPDVTISKIRFLESQGLVDPERTPSGYRKFYDHDVERLRWILRQQRENFLPLKIIRGRLTEQADDLDETASEGSGSGATGTSMVSAEPVESVESVGRTSGTAASARTDGPLVETAPSFASTTHPAPGNPPDNGGVPGRPATAPERSSDRGSDISSGASSAPSPTPPTATPPALTQVRRSTVPPRAVDPEESEVEASRLATSAQVALGEDAETFSAEELAHAAGGTPAIVTELQQYGLISPRVLVGGLPYFDAGALEVVRAAAGFARHGVEARHLRAWRNAADREAGLFEQVIMPLLRQRNPQARQQAAATLAELASLGGDLRKALLDQALRQIR
jgi:DNA-binding transcriptional MerR regulator